MADVDEEEYPPVDSDEDLKRRVLSGNGVPYAPVNSSAPANPTRDYPSPGAPSVAPPAPPATVGNANPPMPAVNMRTALTNTVGARPDIHAPQYSPVKHPMWQDAINRIASAGVALRSPSEAATMRNNFEQGKGPANFTRDVADYEQREKDALAENTAEQEGPLRAAQTREANARADVAEKPPEKQGLTPEETTIHDLMTGENGTPRINPQTQKPYSYLEAYQAVNQAKADTKPEKTPSAEDEAISDYEAAKGEKDTAANRDKARDALKTRDKTPRAPTDREEWQKDHPNEPIENYWEAKAGAGGAAKAQAGEESGRAAQAYADDYLKSGKFTGAGDEALMEKYFELAKPSSGFRMTQPQIEMLTKAQDLMNSVVARGKHLFSPNAPYFSTDLRQQIVDTMKNLQTARDEARAGGQKQSGAGKAAPTKGTVEGGYKFKGGDPADKNNWEKQ